MTLGREKIIWKIEVTWLWERIPVAKTLVKLTVRSIGTKQHRNLAHGKPKLTIMSSSFYGASIVCESIVKLTTPISHLVLIWNKSIIFWRSLWSELNVYCCKYLNYNMESIICSPSQILNKFWSFISNWKNNGHVNVFQKAGKYCLHTNHSYDFEQRLIF